MKGSSYSLRIMRNKTPSITTGQADMSYFQQRGGSPYSPSMLHPPNPHSISPLYLDQQHYSNSNAAFSGVATTEYLFDAPPGNRKSGGNSRRKCATVEVNMCNRRTAFRPSVGGVSNNKPLLAKRTCKGENLCIFCSTRPSIVREVPLPVFDEKAHLLHSKDDDDMMNGVASPNDVCLIGDRCDDKHGYDGDTTICKKMNSNSALSTSGLRNGHDCVPFPPICTSQNAATCKQTFKADDQGSGDSKHRMSGSNELKDDGIFSDTAGHEQRLQNDLLSKDSSVSDKRQQLGPGHQLLPRSPSGRILTGNLPPTCRGQYRYIKTGKGGKKKRKSGKDCQFDLIINIDLSETKLTEHDVGEYKEVFTLFDKDEDGVITFNELTVVMKSLGQRISEQTLVTMVREVSDDKIYDSIEFNEFLRMMAKQKENLITPDSLKEAFSIFDKDGDGKLTIDELKCILSSFGRGCGGSSEKVQTSELNDREIRQAVRDANPDAHGSFRYEDFVNLLCDESMKKLSNNGLDEEKSFEKLTNVNSNDAMAVMRNDKNSSVDDKSISSCPEQRHQRQKKKTSNKGPNNNELDGANQKAGASNPEKLLANSTTRMSSIGAEDETATDSGSNNNATSRKELTKSHPEPHDAKYLKKLAITENNDLKLSKFEKFLNFSSRKWRIIFKVNNSSSSSIGAKKSCDNYGSSEKGSVSFMKRSFLNMIKTS